MAGLPLQSGPAAPRSCSDHAFPTALLIAVAGALALLTAACGARAGAQRLPSTASAAEQSATPTAIAVLRRTVTATPTTVPTPSPPTPEPAAVAATPALPPEAAPEWKPVPSAPVPVRVAIPRIGVDARIVPVGEEADGSMSSPATPTDVGWWDLGSRPGDLGSAVLGGHVDFAGYGAAVFWNLHQLQPGDTVQVTSADGSVRTFTVSEVATYQYNDTAVIDRIFRTNDQQDLNLITCGGTFDARSHNYDKRVVVYTTLATGP